MASPHNNYLRQKFVRHTILCAVCHQIKPLVGSCGGGPSGAKRTCVDCRAQYATPVKPLALQLRERGLSYRRIAERLMEQYRPSPSAWIVEQWCREAGVMKGERICGAATGN